MTFFDAKFHINPGGTCIINVHLRGGPPGHDLSFDFDQTDAPCFNYWVGNLDVAEWDQGRNNNGQGIRLPAAQSLIQMWPKREDRIRMELQTQPSTQAIEFEFDTHE